MNISAEQKVRYVIGDLVVQLQIALARIEELEMEVNMKRNRPTVQQNEQDAEPKRRVG